MDDENDENLETQENIDLREPIHQIDETNKESEVDFLTTSQNNQSDG
jgi:hypothetical protein